MNVKQIGGIVTALVGVALIILSFHFMQVVLETAAQKSAEAKKSAKQITGLVPQSPVSGAIGKGIDKQIDKKVSEAVGEYETKLTMMRYGGIALVVVGGGIFLLGRSKKRR